MDKHIFLIDIQDIQNEAFIALGRTLNDEEMDKAIKLLEFGLGEQMLMMYSNIFDEIQNG